MSRDCQLGDAGRSAGWSLHLTARLHGTVPCTIFPLLDRDRCGLVRRGRARASQGPRAGEHRSPPVSGPAGQASAVTARLPCRHRAAGLCVAYCLGPLPDLLDHDACPSIPPGRLRHAHVPLASRPAYALTRVTRVARLTRRLSAATCASASSSPTRPPPPGCPPPHRRRSVDGPETGKGQRASGTGGPVRDMDRIP